MFTTLLFFACADKSSVEEDSAQDIFVQDTATSEPDTSIDPTELKGSEPAEALPAPEFIAVNFDETVRDQSHLVGKPTVLWFYPAADTPG